MTLATKLNRSPRLLIDRTAVVLMAVLAVFMFRPNAAAEGQYSGSWEVAKSANSRSLARFDLFDDGSQVTGDGQLLRGTGGPYDGATISLTRGTSGGGGLRLRFDVSPPNASGRRTLDGRLLVFGGSGPFLSGTFIIDGTARDVIMRQAGSASAAAEPRACRRLEEAAARTNALGTDAVQEVRGIYAEAGLAFGGTRTAAKCRAALAKVQAYERQRRRGAQVQDAQGSRNCRRLEAAKDDAVQQMRRLGMNESGEFDLILQRHGLPGGGASGRYTDRGCALAANEMFAYADRLRNSSGGQGTSVNPGNPDTLGSFSEAVRVGSVNGFAPAFGGAKVTLWDHNGSGMAYENGPGAKRMIWYWTPRRALANAGVRRGVLLFDGRKDGATVSGRARIFKRGCGAYPYRVSGPVTNNSERVTLRGQRPVIAANCDVVGTKPDTLVFNFRSLSASAGQRSSGNAVVPDDDDVGVPGFGVWAIEWRTHNLPAGETLNVRGGPGTRYAVRGELPYGAKGILVMDGGCRPGPDNIAFQRMNKAARARAISKSWCEVEWRNLRGWVFGKYLRPM